MTTRRWLRCAAFGMALAPAIWLFVLGLRLAPWLALPRGSSDSIERRFHAVEQLAAASGPAVASDVALAQRLVAVARGQKVQRERKRDPELGRIAPEQLSARESEALGVLADWHARGGGLPAGEGPLFDAYYLAELALRATEPTDFERLDATLQLGAELRGRGELADLVIGYSIARLGAKWAKARGVALAAHDRYRPRPEQLREALAREGVWLVHLLDGYRGWGLSIASVSGSPFGVVRPRRERLVVEQYYAELVAATAPFADDPEGMTRAITLAEAGLPLSAVLPASPASDYARRMAEACRDYEQARGL